MMTPEETPRYDYSCPWSKARLPRLETLLFPFRGKKIGITNDPLNFLRIDIGSEVMIPVLPHPGAFGFVRAHHGHEGVDLYCAVNEPVFAMESGTVVALMDFTGPRAGSPWWHDTRAVFVEGGSGVINYGEIRPEPSLRLGAQVLRGDPIGRVMTVLRKDKGRPRTMLHLELYEAGVREPAPWEVGAPKPEVLRDPTNLLIAAAGLTDNFSRRE